MHWSQGTSSESGGVNNICIKLQKLVLNLIIKLFYITIYRTLFKG